MKFMCLNNLMSVRTVYVSNVYKQSVSLRCRYIPFTVQITDFFYLGICN